MSLASDRAEDVGESKGSTGNNCACGKPRARSSRQCRECHSAYMREWRKAHPLSVEQRIKMNARSYANVIQRRGRLKKEPCQKCGSQDSQKHHADYSKPLEVEWLCRDCHEKLHKDETTLNWVMPPLTPNEREVLMLVCEGLSTKEIARRLGITPKAAEGTRDRIAHKAGVRHTALMVRWAIKKGLVQA